MEIVEHMIKTNQNRRWDLLENEAFIMVIITNNLLDRSIPLHAHHERHGWNA